MRSCLREGDATQQDHRDDASDAATTLAALRFRVTSGELACRALWAGDSRAYLLSERTGLHAVTRDHTLETDTLELLRSDPPMTNVAAADRDFVVDSQLMTRSLPCVLLAATDGFFGYVETPAHFECVLVGTLAGAGSATEWADHIRQQVQRYTGDDASLALVAVGYRDCAELRSLRRRGGGTWSWTT